MIKRLNSHRHTNIMKFNTSFHYFIYCTSFSKNLLIHSIFLKHYELLKQLEAGYFICSLDEYSKGVPRQAEVALGVPGRLRPRIISTFGTTRVVGRQPNAPAAFTPGEIPGTQGTWFCRKEPRKKIPSDTVGNRSRDRPTSSAVP